MLVFKFGGNVDASYLKSLRRLKLLVADMEMIATGHHPAEFAVLDETPILSNWSTVACAVTALVGERRHTPYLLVLIGAL